MLWLGPLDRDGYGTFYLRKRTRRAHRVGWFRSNGPIPDEHVINHACSTRHCVNAQHLEVITVTENALRNSRSLAARNRQKTTCPVGHPYDRVYGGQRYCSVCDAAKSRRLRRKWAAEARSTKC